MPHGITTLGTGGQVEEFYICLLYTSTFAGGQDNLQAVVKAAEIAGETKGGAVLWAHGPLPVLNEEIYIMPPYVAAPTFYELPLGSGETDTYDFFLSLIHI